MLCFGDYRLIQKNAFEFVSKPQQNFKLPFTGKAYAASLAKSIIFCDCLRVQDA